MRVGFVGLGTMGLPMARCLLVAGHDVTCRSRSQPPVDTLVGEGAKAAQDAAGVTRASDVTILCLPDDEVVKGIVEQMLGDVDGRIIIDCSTIGPRTAQHLYRLVKDHGGSYLDAPISGGPVGAAAGTLAVMVGGDAEALDLARPALEAFAGQITHVGGSGAGQVVKLANQLIVGANVLALAEAVLLAEDSDVDPADVHRVLVASTGDSYMARTRFPAPGVVPASPASNDWRPDFTTSLMAKDLDLALAHATQVGSRLLSTELVRRLLAASSQAGNDKADFTSFIEVLRNMEE